MTKSKESWNKKELEKKKGKKRQDKAAKKEERKANAKEGKSFEDMIAYMDEYGNISSTPPDPTKKVSVKVEDIEIGVRKVEHVKQETVRKGTVTFFNNSKGYGFIRDSESGESVFAHVNGLIDPISEGNLVTFEVEQGHRGPNAIGVKIVR